jgi:hypothetical protein
MPSPRNEAVTAGAWSIERRPRDAMPDFGDRDMAGYIPGETGIRAEHRKSLDKPRARRNGLPQGRFYITPTPAAWLAANGKPLPAGHRPYQGSDFDLMEYTEGPRYWEQENPGD